KDEMTKLLRLLEVIAVRFQLVGRGRPGRIESLGGRVARDIWEGKITRTAEVRPVLDELYIADDDFKQRFKSKVESDGKKARYILATLERQSLQREGLTYPKELIPGDVTLEHIFPKSPQEFWAQEVSDDPRLSGMLHRLGNMCLLPEVNRALGNKGWLEKLEAFSKSRLKTTNTVTAANYPKWGTVAIEKRQGYMAELAAAAWRYA
ncbi:MAG: HNH endonuclease family protein, partial [Xanthobacteraceae bacterium]